MNPYAQYVNPAPPGGPEGNPYAQFIAAPTVGEVEQETIAKVNNPDEESPEHLGFVPVDQWGPLTTVVKSAGRAAFVAPVEAAGTAMVQSGELAQSAPKTDPIEAAKVSAARRAYDIYQSRELPSIGDYVAMQYGIAKDVALSLLPSNSTVPKTLIDAGKSLSGKTEEFNKLYGLNTKGFASDVGGAFGSIARSIFLTKATGSAAPSAALFFALQDSAIYKEARAAGLAPEEAANTAFQSGAANALIEYAGGKYFLGAAQQSPFIRKVLTRTMGQGAEEGAQQGAEELITEKAGIRKTSTQDKLLSVGYAFMLGTIGGAPVSAITSALEQHAEDIGLGKEKAKEVINNLAQNQAEIADAAARLLYNESSGIAKSQDDTDAAVALRDAIFAEEQRAQEEEAALNEFTPEEREYLNNFLSAEEKESMKGQGVVFSREGIPSKPLSLAAWIQKQGGLQDLGGDVAHVLGGAKYRPGLINKNGKPVDDLAQMAAESGYFPSRPDMNQFLDKLTEDLKGNLQYSDRDAVKAAAYSAYVQQNAEIDRLTNQLEIDTENKSKAQVWEEIANKLSRQQWEQEIAERDESSRADFEYAERKEKEWLESRGEAWEPDPINQLSLQELENEWRAYQEATASNLSEIQGGAGTGRADGAGAAGVQAGDGQRRGGAKSSGRSKQEIYARVIAERRKSGVGDRTGEVAKDVQRMLGAALTPISTRLKNINPKLKARLRKYEFDVRQRINEDQAAIKPFLDKFTNLPSDVQAVLDFAMKNGDADMINEIAAAHGMTDEIAAVRKTLNGLYLRSKAAGLETSYREDYFPRHVLKPEKLIAHFRKTDEWGQISEALRSKEREIGKLTSEDKAELINTLLRGYGKSQLALAKPGNLKERKIDRITPEIMSYYNTTDQALLRYISGVNTNIETRSFFGKGAKFDKMEDNIGWFVLQEMADGNVKPSQEQELTDMLQARFKHGHMSAFWRTYKNIEYLSTMGSPLSAVTQLGDLAYAMYKNGVYRTGAALPGAIAGRSEVSRSDIGTEEIAQEFADQGTTGKALRAVFKVTGFDKMDAIGKETLINGALQRYRARAKKPTQEFRESLEIIFGEETDAVISDLKAGKVSENVKLLLFNELLDLQPIALSEMPEAYLRMGNGRIFYMLKTFTIKQLDVYRAEVFSQMRTDPVKGLKNMTRLLTFMMIMNASADYLKDLLLGRETEPDDILINNLFRAAGISKYQVYTAKRDGLGKAAFATISPPFSIVDKGFKDFMDAVEEGDVDVNNLQSVQNVPIAGKFYYWWMGAGAE